MKKSNALTSNFLIALFYAINIAIVLVVGFAFYWLGTLYYAINKVQKIFGSSIIYENVEPKDFPSLKTLVIKNFTIKLPPNAEISGKAIAFHINEGGKISTIEIEGDEDLILAIKSRVTKEYGIHFSEKYFITHTKADSEEKMEIRAKDILITKQKRTIANLQNVITQIKINPDNSKIKSKTTLFALVPKTTILDKNIASIDSVSTKYEITLDTKYKNFNMLIKTKISNSRNYSTKAKINIQKSSKAYGNIHITNYPLLIDDIANSELFQCLHKSKDSISHAYTKIWDLIKQIDKENTKNASINIEIDNNGKIQIQKGLHKKNKGG